MEHLRPEADDDYDTLLRKLVALVDIWAPAIAFDPLFDDSRAALFHKFAKGIYSKIYA